MRLDSRRAILPAFGIFLCGCQLVGGYDEFRPDPKAPAHPCNALPESKDDPLGLNVMTRVDIPGATCIWMDQTEVTVTQYERWKAEVSSEAVEWEATWCVWKDRRSEPSVGSEDGCVKSLHAFDLQPFAPKKPIRCIDFCDAEAFCRWAGKRLCNDVSGVGSTAPRGLPREWPIACTNGSSTVFPWGDVAERGLCNIGKTDDACIGGGVNCGPSVVGQQDRCSTSTGIEDLLGNVSEWVFACNFVDPSRPLEPTACLTRGGGYNSPLEGCFDEHMVRSDSRSPALGTRCCADLTTSEELLVRDSTPR